MVVSSSDEEQLVCAGNLVPSVLGAESVAGTQVETSPLSRATVVASDSALALAGRELFPDLRQGAPSDAQVEIAGQSSDGVTAFRTPETVVDVFPMTDGASAEIRQLSARRRCRRLVLVPQPPGGALLPPRTGTLTAQTVCQVWSLEERG